MDWRHKIEERFLEKAKSIIDEESLEYYSDEEKYRKEAIIALCLKYGFKYQFVGDCVFIYSIIDEWYFCFMKQNIALLHKNKLHTTKQYHCQKKFSNIIHAIQYIKKHDNFYYKPNRNHKFNTVEKVLSQNQKL